MACVKLSNESKLPPKAHLIARKLLSGSLDELAIIADTLNESKRQPSWQEVLSIASKLLDDLFPMHWARAGEKCGMCLKRVGVLPDCVATVFPSPTPTRLIKFMALRRTYLIKYLVEVFGPGNMFGIESTSPSAMTVSFLDANAAALPALSFDSRLSLDYASWASAWTQFLTRLEVHARSTTLTSMAVESIIDELLIGLGLKDDPAATEISSAGGSGDATATRRSGSEESVAKHAAEGTTIFTLFSYDMNGRTPELAKLPSTDADLILPLGSLNGVVAQSICNMVQLGLYNIAFKRVNSMADGLSRFECLNAPSPVGKGPFEIKTSSETMPRDMRLYFAGTVSPVRANDSIVVCNIRCGEITLPLYVHGAEKKNLYQDHCPVPAWAVTVAKDEEQSTMSVNQHAVTCAFPSVLREDFGDLADAPVFINFFAYFLSPKAGKLVVQGEVLSRALVPGELLPKRKRNEAFPPDVLSLLGAVGMKSEAMRAIADGEPADASATATSMTKRARNGGFAHLLK